MPMSGNIIAVNTELKVSPEIINEECYDEGWLIRFELSNKEESLELLSSKDYKEFLLEEED
jgi:glycine cleavage system H protein